MCVSQIKQWLETQNAAKAETPKPVSEPKSEPAPNPFIGWKAEGLSLQEVIILKFHRGLSDAEIAQALQAGYVPFLPVVEGVDRSNKDLSAGQVWEGEVPDDTDVTLTYTLRPGTKEATMYVFGSRGTQVLYVRDGYGEFTPSGNLTARQVKVPLLHGQRGYTFQKKSVGNWMAAQLVQS